MNKIKAILGSFFIVFFAGVFIPVSAQYDTNLVLPDYKDGGEVYGIDIGASEQVTFFPEGCESIDKVTIKAQENISGEIFLSALQENPQPDVTELEKVFEYCFIELKDINEEDIESVDVELKVRKSWLEENEVDENNIALFTFDADSNSWQNESTSKKTESSIYSFYESQASNFPYWAVAKHSPGLLDNFNPGILLLCCIILLVLFILLVLVIASRRRGQVESA